ncbi:MAG: hypothetical protein Q8939_19355 [Bacteroidota bacterium]|nr:hypothetical protein [Bacteroidota bacterium]
MSKLRRATPASDSEKSAAVRTKFAASVDYAKKAIKDAATKAMYQAMATEGRSAFNVATADAFNPPTVDSINTTNYHGAVGDEIIVRAEDDFKVAGVKVSIESAAGALLEQGDAVMLENTIDWSYKTTQANPALAGSKITAVASDLPGNNTTLSVTL